jgi:cellulose synthase/poly-beta-1,6-N-acetylglucosamine synthase-like glycosyltransferase
MLIFVLSCLSLVIIAFWVWFGSSLAKYKATSIQHHDWPSVSIVITYKNEAPHIASLVKRILSQSYQGDIEVITIDDYSTDGGYELLQDIDDPRLISRQATEDLPGKKRALTEAIGHTRYPFLLMTDGDCLPVSDLWIKNMMTCMEEHTDIVCGYAPHRTADSGLGLWQQYETWITAMQYMTYAMSGLGYMAVGRNMLVRRSAYDKVKGYTDHAHIIAGDDDMLVQSVVSGDNIKVCLSPSTFIYSDAKPSLSSYLTQKSRHISVSRHYKLAHKCLLGLFASSQLLFWMIAISGLAIYPLFWREIVIVICFKWIVQMISHHKWLQVLHCRDLRYYFPILDMATPLYYIRSGVMSIMRKSRW